MSATLGTHWVCRYCIAGKGLKGSDLKNWPSIDDKDAQILHIESEHHIPVCREGEGPGEAAERFYRQYPEAIDQNTCKCPACVYARRRKGRDNG